MRTLEDWFKYLEQQYVDEKAQKESGPPQEQTPQRQQPAQPEPMTSRVTAPSVQEQRQQEVPKGRPSAVPPSLEQVQVVNVSVPDPADYIFTLRRPTSEPATPADAEEETKREKRTEAVSEAKQPDEQMATPAEPEQVTSPAAESIAEETPPEEAPSEAVVGQTERAQRAKPVKRAPYTRSVRPVPPPQSIEDLWKRVPKHVRLLVELGDDEVTQKYYDRQFKESRQELVERLLNPSLTLEDTARLLGVCPTTVRRYTERGLLNHYRTPGNQRRFRLSDVIAFLEARQQAQEARRRKR